jgi:hypothetical protein
MNIPMLKCSSTYIKGILHGLEKFKEPKYFASNRINWTYKYDNTYYQYQLKHFNDFGDDYINNGLFSPSINDIYSKKSTTCECFTIIIKIIFHKIFFYTGFILLLFIKRNLRTLRKCYVDDINLVYNISDKDVLYLVFPFPLSITRQINFIKYLLKNKINFILLGNNYCLRDLFIYIYKRNILYLKKLETRASIRTALFLNKRVKFSEIQSSDEFDICSLDFCRLMNRKKKFLINGAHGAGCYLPVHGYHQFNYILNNQSSYYKSLFKTNYKKFSLIKDIKVSCIDSNSSSIGLVFLSQIGIKIYSEILTVYEHDIFKILSSIKHDNKFEIFYKTHPNNKSLVHHENIKYINKLDDLPPLKKVIFMSFFSTSHIHRNFIGESILIKHKKIFPEILFDNDGSIVSSSDLSKFLNNFISN